MGVNERTNERTVGRTDHYGQKSSVIYTPRQTPQRKNDSVAVQIETTNLPGNAPSKGLVWLWLWPALDKVGLFFNENVLDFSDIKDML